MPTFFFPDIISFMRVKIKFQVEGNSHVLNAEKHDIFSKAIAQITDKSIATRFPPKALSYSSQDTFASLNIKDGEMLIVTTVAGSVATENSETSKAHLASPTKAIPSSSLVVNKNAVQVPEYNENNYYGFIVARIMKDDNSCLFRTIAYVCEDKNVDQHPNLRTIVATTIRNDPFNYNEAILGRPAQDYINWILKPNSWGGAIELRIFSDYYKVEINSIDVSTGRVDIFGEEKGFSQKVFVFYSGIHYDAIALTPTLDAITEFDQTKFDNNSLGECTISKCALSLAKQWKKDKKFTDLANFTLKCDICGKGVKGEKDAQEHATQTLHQKFVEYS